MQVDGLYLPESRSFIPEEQMLERRHTQLKDFIRDKQGEDFCIPEMTEQSVKKALASLQINKSTGSDNISTRLLKPAAPVIAAPITAIMNNSIRTGMQVP